MPKVPIPSGEINAYYAIVNAAPNGATEVMMLQTRNLLVFYSDVYTAVMRQLDLFQSNWQYLANAMAVFTDSQLVAVGIYNNKVSSSPIATITNPVLIINSTITGGVTISASSPPSSPPVWQALVLLGKTFVNNISLTAGTTLNQLYIGPGSTVDVFNSSSSGAQLNLLYLAAAKSLVSKLNAAVFGSFIDNIDVSDGSYFGGYSNDDPNAVCNLMVTGIEAIATCNSIQLIWIPPNYQSPPNAYLFINIYSRQTGSNAWILADETQGYFNEDKGFTFTDLPACASYDFKVVVTCTNGGNGTPSYLTVSTPSCGGSSPTTKVCTVEVNFVTTPNSAVTQTLCDGQTIIALQYAPGASVVVPYMVGKIPMSVVINNNNYQNFPFSTVTGTFNAAASTIRNFVNGMVMTFLVEVN